MDTEVQVDFKYGGTRYTFYYLLVLHEYENEHEYEYSTAQYEYEQYSYYGLIRGSSSSGSGGYSSCTVRVLWHESTYLYVLLMLIHELILPLR